MTLDRIFGSDGPFARNLRDFELRTGQLQMAQLVERGIMEGMHTIVEAGTGVGKSLAYLVPALRSGKKVVLSTGTIALQEQLVQKDIPLVEAALGIPVRVTLLKGRSHYLCRQKFERMREDRPLAPSPSLQRVSEWASRTQTGDRAELPFVLPGGEWEQLDADADECVGEYCPHFRNCFYFNKRDQAKYADVVVVNHALFFLDLAVGGGLLPPYDVAVLDDRAYAAQDPSKLRAALRLRRRVRCGRSRVGIVARARSGRSLSACGKRGSGASAVCVARKPLPFGKLVVRELDRCA